MDGKCEFKILGLGKGRCKRSNGAALHKGAFSALIGLNEIDN